MNNFEIVKEILAFIEVNLKEGISTYEVAQHVNFSVPHTYRLFKAITGETIKTYIMKRRLALAAIEVRNGSRNISDIAFEYGFESHDVFTRAFIRTFNISPSKCRRDKIDTGIYQLKVREDILLSKRSEFMKYSIINKDEINIIGMECKAMQWDRDGAIGRLWSDFLEEVSLVNEPLVPNVMYGICEHETCGEDKTFTYMAGIEVKKGCIVPKEMIKRVVRAQKYLLAEVPADVNIPSAYREAFKYMEENNLDFDNNDELEVYEEIFRDPDNNSFKLLLPIK